MYKRKKLIQPTDFFGQKIENIIKSLKYRRFKLELDIRNYLFKNKGKENLKLNIDPKTHYMYCNILMNYNYI
jgi:hypothetical protein